MAGPQMSGSDDIAEAITDFVVKTRFEDIGGQALDALMLHFVDAYGCGIAATQSEPSRIARNVVAASPTSAGASVIGLGSLCSPELAAFANSCMVRGLDFNDTYNSKSGGHPSVMFPAILAIAEVGGLSGRDVIKGIFVASEVYGALCDSVSLREHGWDAGAFVSIATAAGVASLISPDKKATEAAISLSATSNVPLGVIRAGMLSAWKGCAEGHAVLNGVFLARLAAAGMTGPTFPFRGTTGFIEQVARPMELGPIGTPKEGLSVLERTAIKFLPVQWSTQAPVETFIELSKKVRPADIRSIHISGNLFLHKSVGGGRGDKAEKWDPRTRETADHSIAYLAAVALTDGLVDLDSYRQERIVDPALRPLMHKIEVTENPETRRLAPGRQPVKITITLNTGEVVKAECEFAKGHYTRPASAGDIEAKFHTLVAPVLGENTFPVLETLRGLPKMSNLTGLSMTLRGLPN